ncbi:MAG TPA: sulfite exporter TauE/SafE family protein [Planctomycetota bacterium]|nr:sulfite exporter TauE/SafE family protein [Planctomycetota bacterium]
MEWFQHPDSSAPPAAYLAAGFVAVMLIAVSKGGFGSGLGMLSVPVMMQVLPSSVALPMMLPVLIWCDVLAIRQYPGEWRPRAVWLVAPGAMAGIVIGWGILYRLNDAPRELRVTNDAWLKLVVGAICLGFVAVWALGLWLGRRAGERPAWRPGWVGGTLAGLPSGITTMLAHAAGPIYTMYLLPQKLDKREFVGTTVRYFFTFNLVKIPFFMMLPGGTGLNWPVFRATLWMLALAPLGVWAGSRLNRKLSPGVFNRLLYLFLALAGAKLIWDSSRVLWPGGGS